MKLSVMIEDTLRFTFSTPLLPSCMKRFFITGIKSRLPELHDIGINPVITIFLDVLKIHKPEMCRKIVTSPGFRDE
jgi:hypothetical protein